jgi:lipopolysaccharide export system permease protein
MKILDRYIAKAIISYTLLVLLILIALYTFLAFVTELEEVGQGSYRVSDALSYYLFHTSAYL